MDITPEFTQTGIKTADPHDILDAVRADWKRALGESLNTDPETPQGQLIDCQAAIIARRDSLLLDLVNQLNPDTATGVMQDALASVYFLERKPAGKATVQVECRGKPGQIITGKDDGGGVIIKSKSGDQFVCQTSQVIPQSGELVVVFEAVHPGEISALPGDISVITKGVPGLESCVNIDAAYGGTNAESRGDFARRIRQSAAVNSSGGISSIYSNIRRLEGVISCVVLENPSARAAEIQGINLDAHSVYVCVYGGDPQQIADVIFRIKPAGCVTCGNTEVKIKDNISAAVYPVRFERPNIKKVKIHINILKDETYVGISEIREAVYKEFESLCAIGTKIYASSFYSVLDRKGAKVAEIFINGAASVSMDFKTIPVADLSDITVSLV